MKVYPFVLLALPTVLASPTIMQNDAWHETSADSSYSEASLESSSSHHSTMASSGSGSSSGYRYADSCLGSENIVGGSFGAESSFEDGGWYKQNDMRILNFALSLEQLASSLYNSSLSRYDEQCFEEKGYPEWVRSRYEQIARNEELHAHFLEEAIRGSGGEIVERCEYIFPDQSPAHFVELSQVVASVAVSALNGALRHIESKEYASVIGSILGVESRVSSWINSAVKKQSGWNMAFETPITFSQAWSIAKNFISTCPESNIALLPEELRSFPPLLIPSRVEPGYEMEISFDESYYKTGNALFGAFLVGTGTYLQPVSVVIEHSEAPPSSGSGSRSGSGSGMGMKRRYFLTPPAELKGMGEVYITLVQSELMDAAEVARIVGDQNTVAGPAIVMFPYNSRGEAE